MKSVKKAHTIRSLRVLTVLLAAMMAGSAWADENTIDIKIGTSVKRTIDDLKSADYAYGPKQDFDASAKETHIWLPYGSKGVYFETVGIKNVDPEPGKVAMMYNGVDGYTPVSWGYKLKFDKPITGFRMGCSMAELGLKNAVAGVEYSTDGKTWTVYKQVENKGGNVQPFVKPTENKITGLNTTDLYIRFYSRSKSDPTATRADGAWFKLWTAGDPSWGDAATTFFNIQPQIWVTSAE